MVYSRHHQFPVELVRTANQGRTEHGDIRLSAAHRNQHLSAQDPRTTSPAFNSASAVGSGGGIGVLLSAKRVGPTGKAYGLDMRDEMLALARENQVRSGLTNVEFLKVEIERIPLPDNSVDVIISNCVINLSADKDRVRRSAF